MTHTPAPLLCRNCSRPVVRCELPPRSQAHGMRSICGGWRHDVPGLSHSITCDDGGRDGESFQVAAPPEVPRPGRTVSRPYSRTCPECAQDAECVAADVLISGMRRDVFLCAGEDGCGLQFDVSSYADAGQ